MSLTIIGISGASGSGKSLFAETVVKEINSPEVVLISEDAYYRDLSHLSRAERDAANFDHPPAFEHDLMIQQLLQLQQGLAIEIPIYNHTEHVRRKETQAIPQPKVLVLEGLLLFYEPVLRDLIDLKIFIEADLDLCLLRRLKRDIAARDRSVESVLTQYETTVQPMYWQFVEPFKRYADLIVPHGGGNQVAIEVIKARIRAALL